jgi:hypothetical protein
LFAAGERAHTPILRKDILVKTGRERMAIPRREGAVEPGGLVVSGVRSHEDAVLRGRGNCEAVDLVPEEELGTIQVVVAILTDEIGDGG